MGKYTGQKLVFNFFLFILILYWYGGISLDKRVLVFGLALIVVLVGGFILSFNVDSSNSNIYLSKSNFNSNDAVNNVLWVRGVDMWNIDFNALKQANIDTVFLNFAAIDEHGKDSVSRWVEAANNHGIKVHIWMQVLYYDDFINPLENGTLNQELLDNDTLDAREYASIPGIRGIVLDYIRYPGTAAMNPGGGEAITTFVTHLVKNIKDVNSSLVVSGSLMPEESQLYGEYGQNLTALSTVLDYIIPMIYKGNYEQNSSWIESTTRYFVDNSHGAKVIVSLQSYQSDDNITKLSASEFQEDIDAAYRGGAYGIGIFRFGLTSFNDFDDNLADFNRLKVLLSSRGVNF